MESPKFAMVLALEALLVFDIGFMNALYRVLFGIWHRRYQFASSHPVADVLVTKRLIANHTGAIPLGRLLTIFASPRK